MPSAGTYVPAPSTTLGAMDFYPLAGKCQGPALDLSGVAGETDYNFDFTGRSKGTFTYRGAYAGEGANPGWALQADLKVGGPSSDDNTPPAIASPAWADPNPVTLPAGTTAHVVASDPDGDPLGYAWSQISGPGTATFATPTATDSGVTFASSAESVGKPRGCSLWKGLCSRIDYQNGCVNSGSGRFPN